MMDRISICEVLVKWNEIDPFLKRMVNGEVIARSHTTLLSKTIMVKGAVKQLKRWPNQDYWPGRFYCVFGGTGKESNIRDASAWPNTKFRSLLSTTGPFEASD
ncbi:hypothetical protein TNCV_3040931 [Trichonephila clavipes]|nr:hypothetical protein TNCV_3040931 [Trichonephila clavipes]